ncbi:hypothetical protein KXV52_000701, partial [Aspergillus fumigatus]
DYGKRPVRNKVIQWSQDANVFPALMAPTTPRVGVLEVKDKSLPELTVLWYVVQLMRAKPSLFPRTNITTDPIRLSPYDVLHGWKLLSFFWKQIQGGKKAKGKPQKNVAIPPVFHTPTNPNAVLGSGPNTASAGDPGTAAAPVSVTADALFGADHAQANSYMATKQRADQLGNSALLHHDTVQEALEKVFRSDLSSAKATISRPAMTAVERDLLYKHMMEMDNFESELILHEPTDTSVGGSQTQVFLNRLAATSQASELIRVAAAEENDTEPDEATTEAPGTGLQVQGRMTLSAVPPTYNDACQTLALDPVAPLLFVPSNLNQAGTRLKQWQVTGAAWMLEQEKSPVGGGILADACGTGKTTTLITTLWYSSVAATKDPTHTHRPTLVLCPSALIDTWLGELRARLGDAFRILLFQGSSLHTSDYLRKSLTVDTLSDLETELRALDPTDIGTTRTIILSSYTTWSMRIMPEVDVGAGQMDGAGDGVGNDDENDLAIEQLAEMQAQTMEDDDTAGQVDFGSGRKGRQVKRFDTHLSGWFGRVVCDEGHAAKTIRTRVHQSVARLEAEHVWFLTATPLYNRAFDLCGYLAIFYSGLRRAGVLQEGGDDDSEVDWFPHYKELADQAALPSPPPYRLLQPKAFVSLFRFGHLAPKEAYWALPGIMRMLCLRRDMGDPIEAADPESGLIGDDIPPLRIMTIDLRNPPRIHEDHNTRFVKLLSEMKKGHGSARAEAHDAGAPGGDSQGHLDWRVMRLLCHLSFSLTLDDYYRRADDESDTMAAAIGKSIERGDRGFADFWWRTCEGARHMMPTTRLGQAYYLTTDAIKLRYLMRIFYQEGLFSTGEGPRPRFLVFVHWPMVMWLVEMFLDSIGVNYVTIRATMTDSARREAAEQFISVDSKCDVLLTSYQCGAHGLNLHGQCSRVVLLEPPLNMNTLFQAVGRVHRLGQGVEQKAWILFQ